MNAYYLSLKPETPNNDYWDYGFLNDFIDGSVWKPPNFPQFEKHEVSNLPNDQSAIVVVPARHHADMFKEVNRELRRIDNVVLFLMGDEEADFPVEDIKHRSIHVWVQNPHPERHDEYHKLGTGYPPQLNIHLPKLGFKKSLDVYFAGQITHSRRFEMEHELSKYQRTHKRVLVQKSESFTSGVDHQTYYQNMRAAKVCPAPSGAIVPDSFRLFEALESMSIVIADEVNPDESIDEYWDWLMGPNPLIKLKRYSSLNDYIKEALEEWPVNVQTQTSWWMRWKRDFAYKICNQLEVK